MAPKKAPNRRSSILGKHVNGAVYVHRSAASGLERKYLLLIEKAERLIPQGFFWTVVKFDKSPEKRVSFLDYEDFNQSAFPALRRSCLVDIGEGVAAVREYSSQNPPILHRKELLLAFDDPRRPKFSGLTHRLEELGLFKDMHKMGRRRPWEEALRLAGLELDCFELVEKR